MWTRIDLKEKAKSHVAAFYWPSVLAAFLLTLTYANGSNSGRKITNHDVNQSNNYLIEGVFKDWIDLLILIFGVTFLIAIAAIAIHIFVMNPLEVGCKKFFLETSYGKSNLSNLAFGFKNNYSNIVCVILLRNVFVSLWSLLLIIPGIIKAYEYHMIPYLLSENPSMSFNEAKSISSKMMDGQKWDAFVLDLSFILWDILSILTFGLVGIFWLAPYTAFTNAELYKVLSNKDTTGFNNDNTSELDTNF